MADVSQYAKRHWKYSALLRELDRDGGDAELIQDCLNELSANALHAPTPELRRRSQAAVDAHYAQEMQNVRGI